MEIKRKRSWSVDELRKAVKASTSFRQVLERLNLCAAGGNYVQIQKYIREYKLDIIHFKGRAWNKGLTGIGKPIIPLKDILKKDNPFQSYKLKKRLLKEGLKPGYCEECGWAKKTESGHLPLELHHINGDRFDNRLGNLKVLCPNCHSLKPNHRGRGQKRSKVN